MPLKMRVHDREHIGAALRRFKKLLERSGITKELRKRKFSGMRRPVGCSASSSKGILSTW